MKGGSKQCSKLLLGSSCRIPPTASSRPSPTGTRDSGGARGREITLLGSNPGSLLSPAPSCLRDLGRLPHLPKSQSPPPAPI